MKVDAEGAEEEVLCGAANTLRRCRPVLSVEIEERHRPGSTLRVPRLMAELGFEAYFECHGEWRSMHDFDPERLQRGSASPACFEVSDPYVFWFCFVPLERRAEFANRTQ